MLLNDMGSPEASLIPETCPIVEMSSPTRTAELSELATKKAELCVLQKLVGEANGVHPSPLLAQLSQLHSDIETLSSEIDASREKESSNVESLHALKEKKAKLEKENEDKTKRLEDEAEALQKGSEELEKKLESVVGAQRVGEKKLMECVAREKAELDAQRRQNQKILLQAQGDAGVAPLEAKKAKLAAEVEKLKAETAKIAASLEASAARLATCAQEVAEEDRKRKEMVEIAELQLKESSELNCKRRQESTTITEKTNRMIEESEKTKHMVQEQESTNKVLRSQVAELRIQKEDDEAKRLELKESSTNLKREELRMTAEIKKIESGLESQRQQEKSRLKSLTDKEEKLHLQLQKIKDENAAAKEQFSQEFDREVQKARKQASTLVKDQLKEETRALDEQKGDSDQLRIRVKALEKQVLIEKKKIRDIQHQA